MQPPFFLKQLGELHASEVLTKRFVAEDVLVLAIVGDHARAVAQVLAEIFGRGLLFHLVEGRLQLLVQLLFFDLLGV